MNKNLTKSSNHTKLMVHLLAFAETLRPHFKALLQTVEYAHLLFCQELYGLCHLNKACCISDVLIVVVDRFCCLWT